MASRAREFSQINIADYATTGSLSNYAPINSPSFTGTVSFPSGSASAPSISASGDANTGIFFPSADTIALSEGGTEAMRIDSAGRVTIPGQTMFYGMTYSGNGTVSGSYTAIRYANIDVNVGNHFNNTTGIFTCPTSGLYLAINNLNLKSVDNNWMGSIIQKNGSSRAQGWSMSSSGNQYSPALCFSILSCEENDTIMLGWANAYAAPNTGSVYNQGIIAKIG